MRDGGIETSCQKLVDLSLASENREEIMHRTINAAAIAISLTAALPDPAGAGGLSYAGQLVLANSTSTLEAAMPGAIAFAPKPTATLPYFFATSGNKEILLAAVFTQVSVQIEFTPMPCPTGFSGPCNKVTSVMYAVTGAFSFGH